MQWVKKKNAMQSINSKLDQIEKKNLWVRRQTSKMSSQKKTKKKEYKRVNKIIYRMEDSYKNLYVDNLKNKEWTRHMRSMRHRKKKQFAKCWRSRRKREGTGAESFFKGIMGEISQISREIGTHRYQTNSTWKNPPQGCPDGSVG